MQTWPNDLTKITASRLFYLSFVSQRQVSNLSDCKHDNVINKVAQ